MCKCFVIFYYLAKMLAVIALLNIDGDEDLREFRLEQFKLKRSLRDVNNAFQMGDESFRRHYRMYPEIAIDLIEMLAPNLPDHSRGVRPHLQVLAVLRFLAEGSYQKGVSQELNHPMAQSTYSKYLHAVISAINLLARRFISFPRTREERQAIQAR